MARKRVTLVTAFHPALLRNAVIDAFKKLDLRRQFENPVMFCVEIGGILTTLAFLYDLIMPTRESALFTGMVSAWLWLTVLFSNFAESLAEGRGKARAASLRRSRTTMTARKLASPQFSSPFESVASTDLRPGDLVLVQTGDLIPSDGEVIAGAALINEAAITGESAPVVRESGGDRSAVTGGTTVIANEVIIRITAEPGKTFLDCMIQMIEGAKRRKTPNEQALETLLFSLTGVFLLVVAVIWPVSAYSAATSGSGSPVHLVVLVALFVCLAPTTIAALLPAIGIAGMDRLFQRNIIAMSGRAIEAAGDVNILLLDKTGTITLGNRQAAAFIPIEGVVEADLVNAAYCASYNDETPEGRSVVTLACASGGSISCPPEKAVFIPFSAQTRMSGMDIDGVSYRKGATDAITSEVGSAGKPIPPDLTQKVTRIAQTGGTPLVVSRDHTILGVVHLKDILKPGVRERFFDLRRMGIRTVMITGDNRLTAAAIAAEAGVDDFLAEAKPDDKLRLIKTYQEEGYMVAMTGDGTNDAPALAQADVAVAMNNGTQPAREAANIIDLDSDPTKLIDVVEIGKQILMTRGALTTFSIANDVAKYFAIIPAAFLAIYPQLAVLNVMGLATPESAILSAVIFNALIIPLLIPLALRGVQFRPMPAARLFTYNLVIFGLGGIVAPFLGIKAIDLLISTVVPL
ncbi:MAG: potassium-transporting ATPase subunit KdpB [Methanolinea sp.]|jgi:K+-transporting ATPase ATPase B chain|nr:potassium-transporting ATPase subunit KdpB [Methanolinea sp.]